MRFIRDCAGDPRAIAAPGEQLLAAWLQSDIQEDLKTGAEILALAHQLKHTPGRQEVFGNAYVLTLDADAATLSPLDQEDQTSAPEHHPLPGFIQQLQDWLNFIQQPKEPHG